MCLKKKTQWVSDAALRAALATMSVRDAASEGAAAAPPPLPLPALPARPLPPLPFSPVCLSRVAASVTAAGCGASAWLGIGAHGTPPLSSGSS